MTNKRILTSLLLVFIYSASLLGYCSSKPSKNHWTKSVSEICKTEVTTCSSKITVENNTDQTKACITCCTEEIETTKEENCFNYCTCECSLKSDPKAASTRKLCKKK